MQERESNKKDQKDKMDEKIRKFDQELIGVVISAAVSIVVAIITTLALS